MRARYQPVAPARFAHYGAATRELCKFMQHSSIYAGAAKDPAVASEHNHFLASEIKN